MGRNKCARIEPAGGVIAVTRPDERRRELADLDMEMRPITAPGRADRRDRLAANNPVFRLYQDRFDMGVVRLHKFSRAVLRVSVENDNDVAPAGTAFAGENNLAVGDRENRIAEIAVLAADSVQIVAEMAVPGERLGVVGEGAVLGADREIEARHGRQAGQ